MPNWDRDDGPGHAPDGRRDPTCSTCGGWLGQCNCADEQTQPNPRMIDAMSEFAEYGPRYEPPPLEKRVRCMRISRYFLYVRDLDDPFAPLWRVYRSRVLPSSDVHTEHDEGTLRYFD